MINLAESLLYNNAFVDDIEDIDLWVNIKHINATHCDSCGDRLEDAAYIWDEEFICAECVIQALDEMINESEVKGTTLNSIRNIISRYDAPRWHLFFIKKFHEICAEESKHNQYGLRILLIEQLGYQHPTPFSHVIRQAAFDVCLALGQEIVPMLEKTYRKKPWQLQFNIFLLILNLAPDHQKISMMADDAASQKEKQARINFITALKAINRQKHTWVEPILLDMFNDSEPEVRHQAREILGYKPVPQNRKTRGKNKQNKKTYPQNSSRECREALTQLLDKFQSMQTPEHIALTEWVQNLYTAEQLKTVICTLIGPFFEDQFSMPENTFSQVKLNNNQTSLIFVHLLLNEKLLYLFIQSLPENVVRVLEVLVWEGGVYEITLLENDLNIIIAPEDPKKPGCRQYQINAEYAIFQNDRRYLDWYSLGKGRLYLESGLKDFIRPHLTIPESAAIQSAAATPKAAFTYTDNNQFSELCNILIEYIRQGNIEYTKEDRIAKRSLNKLIKYFDISEFYPESKGELQCLFSRLVIDLLTASQNTSSDTEGIEGVKKILLSFLQGNDFLEYSFLNSMPHLERVFHMGCEMEHAGDWFLILFNELKDHKWVSIENIYTFTKYHPDNIYFLENRDDFYHIYLKEHVYSSNRYRGTWLSLKDDFNRLFLEPYIKGMFFLFAAIGMVDILYNRPENPHYQVQNSDYLTLYDGLKYIRLNDFGKYVLGYSDQFLSKSAVKPSKIIPDEKRLLLRISGEARIQKMILDRLAEPVSSNLYKVTSASFTQNCKSAKDVRNNITLFKKKITKDLPVNWQNFFREIENKINPLSLSNNLRVFKIIPDKELIALISGDEILKKLILKVEDYHIAIEQQKLNLVQKRLIEFGYFIEDI